MMKFRYITSKRGSALVTVMLALVILSMLGTALISLALINLKTNYADKNGKTSLYLAESGLDRAYQEICVWVKQDIDSTQLTLKGEMTAYISEERRKEREEAPYDSELIKNMDNGEVNPDGEIDQNKLYEIMNGRFKSLYYSALVEKNAVTGKVKLVESLENQLGKASLFPGISQIPLLTVEDVAEKSNSLDITLRSQYQYEGMTRSARITYQVTVPEYNQIYTLKTEVQANVTKNALFSKALVAGKDIFVNDATAVIQGDIYAGGSTGNPIEQTGIQVGGNSSSGQLTVRGRTITGGFISTRTNNSVIRLNGDVYGNSLFIPENVDNSTIQVGSNASSDQYNVSLLEDLRIDGSKAKLLIYGNFYGFSSGETSELNRSSIVINSDDIASENGSKVFISGYNGNAKLFPNGIAKPAGNIIAGTSFINLDLPGTRVLYQTGESVSVKGNYVAYTQGLRPDSIFNGPGYVSGDENKFDQPHIFFKSLDPLYVATAFDKNANGELDGEDTYFGGETTIPTIMNNGINYSLYKGLADKTKYFMYSYNQDPALISFGTASSMEIRNVLYSTGIFIDNNIDTKPQQPYINAGISSVIPNLRHEYNYFVKAMGDPQIVNYLDSASGFNDNPSDSIPDTVRTVEDLYRFNSNIEVKPEAGATNPEIFYSSSSSAPIVIKGGSGGYPVYSTGLGGYNTFDIGNRQTKGIIVTKGDVYLVGQIDFTGTIITTGNIYMMDKNTKTISNDYDDLHITASNNYVVNTIYAQLLQPGNQIGKQFVANGSERIYAATTSVETPSKEYINFEEIIQSSNWQRVR